MTILGIRVRRFLTSCMVVATLVAMSDNMLWNIDDNDNDYSTNTVRNRNLLKGSRIGNNDGGGEYEDGINTSTTKLELTTMQTKRLMKHKKEMEEKNLTPQKDLAHDDRKLQRDFSNLRIACFGMSDTWAAIEFPGLDDTYEMNYHLTTFNHEGSYCKKLSPQADNYGFPSQGPNYASTCLQSMIQDKVYDVITVDFPLADALHVEQVVERLRQRFPSAAILVLDRLVLKKVKLQDPVNKRRQIPIEFTMSNFEGRKKREWGGVRNSMRKYNRDQFKAYVEDRKAQKKRNAALSESDIQTRRRAPIAEWDLQYRNSQKEKNEEMHKVYKSIPVPIGDETNLEESLLQVNDYYMDDGITLNPTGHDYVATAIGDVIATQSIQKNAPLGTFGGGDACHLWFTSGDLSGVKLGGSATLENYIDVRHAVSVNPETKGTATIVNPFHNQRTLYITYMVTPDPANQLCNRGRIVVPPSIDVTLDTIGASDYQKMAQIVTPRTIALGKVGPGKHTIEITQIDDGAPLPFRIMGLSFTDEVNIPSEYDFTQNFWYKGFTVQLRGNPVVWA